MQMFENLPWYSYVIIALIIASYGYYYLKKGKEFLAAPEDRKAKFRKNENSTLNREQLFSLSLDAVTNEWWKADINTLTFPKSKHANNYLEGWGIDTADGYWGLTNYFMEDGRRWYFDFILNMMKTKPEENWKGLMDEKFGENERAQRYLNLLKTEKAQVTLKTKGFITFDSEIEIGVVGYDVSVLVGQARRAYTAEIITEEEAWKVINFATRLAKENFSSWEDFGKSFILGFTLDIRDQKDGYLEEIYQLYSQILEKQNSPWNELNWQ